MVDVEVVVHVVEAAFAHELVLDGVVPARERGDRRLAVQLVAQEGAEAAREPLLPLREEDRERGGVAPLRRGAVVGVDGVGDFIGDGIPVE